MIMNKCIFVIGPESSGSKLIARVCAHVLNAANYEDWNGSGWCGAEGNMVCHRSLPFNIPPEYPDIDGWIKKYSQHYNIYFILTTRDITISEMSRNRRWQKPFDQLEEETQEARKIMSRILNSDHNYFIWSYETFMFFKLDYLKKLYHFLGVKSIFIPELMDGNKLRINTLLKY